MFRLRGINPWKKFLSGLHFGPWFGQDSVNRRLSADENCYRKFSLLRMKD